MELIKRLLRYYPIELVLVIVLLPFAYYVLDDELKPFLLSQLAYKTSVWGVGLVLYYIARYLKVGIVDWKGKEHVYAIALLLYTALIFAFVGSR